MCDPKNTRYAKHHDPGPNKLTHMVITSSLLHKPVFSLVSVEVHSATLGIISRARATVPSRVAHETRYPASTRVGT